MSDRKVASSGISHIYQAMEIDPDAFNALVAEWLPVPVCLEYATRRDHSLEKVQSKLRKLLRLPTAEVTDGKHRFIGYVEVISLSEISGWAIDTENAAPAALYILADDVLLVKVIADRERPDVRKIYRRSEAGFNFVPGIDLRALLRDGATITVRASCPNGQEIQKSTSGRISNPGCSSFDTLQSMLSSGFQISAKSGSLFRPIANIPGAFESFMRAYQFAEERFKRLFSRDLFVSYGTLLGLTRDKKLLPHDDDFDIAFCIEANDPRDAAEQFWQIVDTLRKNGENIVDFADGHFHWKTQYSTLDVFVWWRSGGEINGYFLHTGDRAAAAPISVTRADFLGHTVGVPENSAALLAAIYGPGWQTPNPSFQWVVPDVVKARMGAFRSAFREADSDSSNIRRPDSTLACSHWNQFYAGRHIDIPSQFAVFVATMLPSNAIVIEVGCGNGRDAFFFAGLGYDVIGLDASQVAIERNRKKSSLRGLERSTFEAIDVSDAPALEELITELGDKSPGRPLWIYNRFFIHAIHETAERSLLNTVGRLKNFPKITFVAEFRTTNDAILPKQFGQHYRRYIDLSRFRHDLLSKGLKVTYAFEGQGMARYKDEDPFVAGSCGDQCAVGFRGSRDRPIRPATYGH